MGVTTTVAARPGPARGGGWIEVLVTGRCQGCGACLLTCPEHAIRPAHAVGPGRGTGARRPPGGEPGSGSGSGSGGEPGPLSVLGSLCTGCGECVEVCPVDAIEEYRVGASEPAPANESVNVPGNGSDT